MTDETRDTLQRVATALNDPNEDDERKERIRDAIARWSERHATEPSRERQRRRAVKRSLPLLALFLTLPALAADSGDWRKSLEPRWYVGAGPFYLDGNLGVSVLAAYHAPKHGAIFTFGPTWMETGGNRYMVPPGGRTGMEWFPPSRHTGRPGPCRGRDVLYVTPKEDSIGFQFTVLFQID